MRKGLFRLIILLLVFIVAWTFGYMKLPYLESDYTFWIGFVSCLALVFSYILLSPKNRNFATKNNEDEVKIKKNTEQPKNSWILIIAAVSLGFGLFTFLNNRNLKANLEKKNRELYTAKHCLELSQQSQKLRLVLTLINQLDSSATASSKEHLIQRIVTLSSSFRTFQAFDTTNPLAKNYSMERGQLLLALVHTKMDSVSYRKLKENVSFWGAELAKVDLQGLDLSGIDLRFANLQGANLQGITMSNANLTGANLMGCNLNESVLNGINLQWANLSWVKINNAELQNSTLDSADFSNSIIQKSNLSHSTMVWTIFNNALLLNSNLSNSSLHEAQFSKTNLSFADISNIELGTINFNNALLDNVIVDKNWLMQFNSLYQDRPNFIKNKYITMDYKTTISDTIIYYLKRVYVNK